MPGTEKKPDAHKDRAPRGAPVQMSGGKRVNVYLDAESRAAAERIGEGNISAGIRRALKKS